MSYGPFASALSAHGPEPPAPRLEAAVSANGRPDVTRLKRAFGQFPSGVVALAALREGIPVGMVASSFTSVSMAPPLVSVAIQLTSTTWPLLAGRPALGLSVLGAHQGPVCRQLAAVGNDRFREVRWSASETGAVLIDGAVAWLTCATDQIIRTGDHDLVLLAVDAVAVNPGTPLVFHSSSFRRLEATRHRASDADVVQLLPAGDVEFDEAMHPGGRSGVVQLMPAGDVELQEQ